MCGPGGSCGLTSYGPCDICGEHCIIVVRPHDRHICKKCKAIEDKNKDALEGLATFNKAVDEHLDIVNRKGSDG